MMAGEGTFSPWPRILTNWERGTTSLIAPHARSPFRSNKRLPLKKRRSCLSNGFCGLAVERLSSFRPERLALHEVLIRVMADLSVPDGEKYEDLGVNFRKMTAAIMDKYIASKMPEITRTFEQLKRQRLISSIRLRRWPLGSTRTSKSLVTPVLGAGCGCSF
jgi:hypothetical protein